MLGEALTLSSSVVEVLGVERSSIGQQRTRVAVTFRVRTGPSEGVAISDDAVRVFAGGVPYAPTRSWGSTFIARESAQSLSAVFEVEDAGGDLVLRFGDSQRGGVVARRLPPPQ